MGDSESYYKDRVDVRDDVFFEKRLALSARTIFLLNPHVEWASVGRVLEVGSDTGATLFTLSETLPQATLVGIEIGEEAVRKATARQQEKGYKNLSFVQGSALELPFENESFDLVISEQVMEHVEDHSRYMKELARVVKPGGVLFISIPNRWFPLEAHLNTPFIAWFPRKIGWRILKLFSKKKADYYQHVNPLGPGALKRRMKREGLKSVYVSDQLFSTEWLPNTLKLMERSRWYPLWRVLFSATHKSIACAPIRWAFRGVFPYTAVVGKKPQA